MPATSISTGLIGASLTQVWKPVAAIGAASDAYAPFALGTVVHAVPSATGGRSTAVFCRVGANVAIGGAAGIANGVSGTAGTGNNYVNDTGQALVIGDYAFLTAATPTS